MPKIAIIGCGLGGATLALALHRAGFFVRIFEKRKVLGEVGAGIGLLNNAMAALKSLDISEEIESRGHVFHRAELWGKKLLHRLDLEEIAGPKAKNVIIHRAQLLSIILQKIPQEIIFTDHHCSGFEINDGVSISFNDKPKFFADIVIGADGLHSAVRRFLFGEEKPRYLGQTCFRGVAHFPIKERHIIREVFGSGKRASAMPIDEERVYWWAAVNAKANHEIALNMRQKYLLDHFKDWPFSIYESIKKTPSENILQNDIVDKKALKNFSQGPMTLLGDAAHPMAPNLGQGACTSIEDAVVLANCLKIFNGDYKSAFTYYEKERVDRTNMVQRLSYLYGIPCLFKNPLATWARDKLISFMPQSLADKPFKEILRPTKMHKL